LLRWQITNTCLIQPGLRPRRAPPTSVPRTIRHRVIPPWPAHCRRQPRAVLGMAAEDGDGSAMLSCNASALNAVRPAASPGFLVCLARECHPLCASTRCPRIVFHRIAVAVQDATDVSAGPAAAADVDDSHNNGGRDEDWHFLERPATPHECADWLPWQRTHQCVYKHAGNSSY